MSETPHEPKEKPLIQLSVAAVVWILIVLTIIIAFIIGTAHNGLDSTPSGPQNNSPEDCLSAC